MKLKRHNEKRKEITWVLQKIQDGKNEAFELFEMWARRRKNRLDPEHQLAEDTYQEERRYRNQVAYLKRKKLIVTKKIERRLFLELSDEGKNELFRRTISERPKLEFGNVCLVMFDVPVDAKASRDAFRHFLKTVGFVQVQKSIWQSDRDVAKDIEKFVAAAKIRKWIRIYLAKEQC